MFDYYDAHGICGNPTVLAVLLDRDPTSWRQWAAAHRWSRPVSRDVR
jgi:hypothetical protein